MKRPGLAPSLSVLPLALALAAAVPAHAFDAVNAPVHALTATTEAPCQSWQSVPVPSPPSDHAALAAAAASSSSDVWAVGYSAPPSQTSLATLTEHFDGNRWRVVRSPTLGNQAQLTGVAVISPAVAWAVGSGIPSGSQGQVPLLLHWNGARWLKIKHAAFTGAGMLKGISATSASDVWVVGAAQTGTTSRTLIEHFDGSAWSVVPSPSPDTSAQLSGVTAISLTDAWASGTSVLPSQANRTLLEHWDGVSWSTVSTPDQGQILEAVAASSSRDIWAVGLGQSISDALADHFDGTAWTDVPTPAPSSIVNELLGVAVSSTTDAWSVGGYYDHGLHTLIEHWDGSAWSVSFEGALGTLSSVATVPGGGVWAVGALGQGITASPYAAFHC
jgi:hypothetical protein